MTTWYDNNPSWAKEAVEKALAISAEKESTTLEIIKSAGDIGIGTGTLIGGIIGAGLGHKAIDVQKDQKYKVMYGNAVQNILNEQNKKLVDMSSDYYAQIANLEQDLRIMFTPFSVVYMLRGTAVDSISTDVMNSSMKRAWENKDATYFKNILVNRVYLDAQEAEQMFIRRLIEQDKFLKDAINKKSSECALVDYFPEDTHLFEVLASYDYFKELFKVSEKSSTVSKYANILVDTAGQWEDITIPMEVGYTKYANDSELDLGLNKLSFLFFGKKDTPDYDVVTTKQIKKDLQVSYLPDRVLYLSNGIVISQINVMNMNEYSYKKFAEKDDNYFRNVFFDKAKEAGYDVSDVILKESKEGLGEGNFQGANLVSEASDRLSGDAGDVFDVFNTYDIQKIKQASDLIVDGNMIKEASRNTVLELFTRAGIHPKIYYLFLMQEFGKEWLEWDIDTLRNMILDNFTEVKEIGEIPLNKLMTIVLLMNSDASYTGFHTFEKVIRVFNDRTIDFEQRESNLTLGEFVNGIRIMGEIIQDYDDNIYDNFSEHVLGYLVEVLHSRGYRACFHTYKSKQEEMFWKLVNIDLLDLWIKSLPYGITGLPKNQAAVEAKSIFRAIQETYLTYEKDTKVNPVEINKTVEEKLNNANLADDAVKEPIVNNVIKNLAVNFFLKDAEAKKEEQIKYYLD